MESNIYTITIEKIINTGAGLGKLPDGKAIFVPFTLPFEKVKVAIKREKKDYAIGKLIEIIEPSPKRTQFHCSVFTKCGGCNFGHTDYDTEIEIKKSILFEILKKFANFSIGDAINIANNDNSKYAKSINNKENINNFYDVTFSILKSKQRYGYRNNAILKVDKNGELGFFESKSLKIIPFKDFCKLLPLEMESFLNKFNKDVFLFTKGFRIRLGDRIYHKGLPTLKDDKYAYYTVNDFKYRVDIDGFFQVNRFNNEEFQKEVISLIDNDIENFVELYAGVGFFTIPLIKEKLLKNRKIKKIYACELSKTAVKNAHFNINENLGDGIVLNDKSITFAVMDSEQFIDNIDKIDNLLVDPPRSGLTEKIIKNIISKKVKKLIYVSCNPVTFARDIKFLLENNYKLTYLKLLDNFPLTYHIEVIGVLTKI